MEAGCTLWFTGMSGSGKSTLSALVADRLRALGSRVEVIDGDIVRTRLCHGLGFSKDDREENVSRIGFVCELLSRNGVVAIAAAISPYRACREELRSRIPNFIEVLYALPGGRTRGARRQGSCTKRRSPERSRTSPGSPTRTSLPRPRK